MKFALLLFLLPVLFAPSEQMPHFVYSQETKLLLVWGDVWEAGSQNSMVLLSGGSSGISKITIRMRIGGVDAGSSLKRILLYTCPSKGTEESVDLGSLSSSIPTMLCPSDISFTLKSSAASDDEFELAMSTSLVSFSSVFSSTVIMSAKVEYNGGVLTSNTLSMWNLDPISSFPPSSSNPVGYDRHFLSEESIQLMRYMNLGSGVFHNFPFLDSSITSVLQSAPKFFWQKLNVGAILYFDPSGCSSVQNAKSFLFTTYDSKFTRSQMVRMKSMLLVRSTGVLTYARCQLYKAVKSFFDSISPTPMSICLSVTFSGNVVPYSKVSEVKARIPASEFSYSGCTDASTGQCTLVSGYQPNITIYSGMDTTQLLCPIICDDPGAVFTFYRNGQALIAPPSSDWSDFGTQGVRVAASSNIIEFSSDVSSSQAGEYRCSTPSVSFTYYVTVVSMPTFATAIRGQSASLPLKVLAMQGESLSYSCGVSYSGLRSTTLQPAFFLPSSGATSWTENNLDQFNSLVSPSGKSAVNISWLSVGSDAQLMNISIQNVPAQYASLGRNFSHRFVCKASVLASETSDLGMSGFSAQNGGDVFFVPRPTKDNFILDPSNDCATQKCHLGNGARFKFALKSQYTDYLFSIGVDVDLYLRIDNFLLTDIKILMNSNVSMITINGTNITYEIFPITNADVRTELQKRSSLTPVFNFRYKNATEMGNVNLFKSRYGAPTVALGSKDCRADPLCFYSTDFDTSSSGSLSFLNVALDFNNPEPPLAGANLTIMNVVIVVCVVVIVVLVVLVAYFANRPPAKTYQLEEKELEQGRNPTAEAKEEEFKEYVRQSEHPDTYDSHGDIEMRSVTGGYENTSFMYESVHQSRDLAPEGVQIE